MGFLPIVVGVEDSTGARADAKRADGTRSAVIIRFSNMFTASSEVDGGITRVFIGSSIASLDGAGVLTIGASATSIVIGGAGIPVSVPGDFSVGGDITITGDMVGDVTILGDLTVEGTTTTIKSTVLDVADRVIHVNDSEGADDPVPTDIAGIAVHRGAIASVDRDHAGWLWDEANTMWRAAWNTGGDDATIGADLAIQCASLLFGAAVAAPEIYQGLFVGAGVAQPLLIRAASTNLFGGDTGGKLVLQGGAGTTDGGVEIQDPAGLPRFTLDATGDVQISSAADISFQITGSGTEMQVLSNEIRLYAKLAFNSSMTSGIEISQNDHADTPQTMLMHAMDVTTGTGSDLDLRPGSGSVAHGELALQDGGGNNRLLVTADGNVVIGSSIFAFADTVSAPFMGHLDATTGDGENLTITAQTASEAAAVTGGSFLLRAGQASDGGAFANIGGNATLQGGDANGSGASIGGDVILQPGAGATDGEVLIKDGGGTPRVTVGPTGEVDVDSNTILDLNGGNVINFKTGGGNRLIVSGSSAINVLNPLISFFSTVVSPIINQGTLATTPQTMLFHAGDVTTGTGSDLDIRPGSGSVAHGALALQDGGGADRVIVTAAGEIVLSAATNIDFETGGTNRGFISSSQFRLVVPTIRFASGVANPVIDQQVAGTGSGDQLTISAQDVSQAAAVTAGAGWFAGGDATDSTGVANVGGFAALVGGEAFGTGASIGGDVFVQGGEGVGAGGNATMAPGTGAVSGILALQDGGGNDRLVVDAAGQVQISPATSFFVSVGGTRLTVTASEVLAAVPVGVPSYNVAGAPSAAGMDGRIIYVTDGDAGSACLACGDGTNWKVISLGATIST